MSYTTVVILGGGPSDHRFDEAVVSAGAVVVDRVGGDEEKPVTDVIARTPDVAIIMPFQERPWVGVAEECLNAGIRHILVGGRFTPDKNLPVALRYLEIMAEEANKAEISFLPPERLWLGSEEAFIINQGTYGGNPWIDCRLVQSRRWLEVGVAESVGLGCWLLGQPPLNAEGRMKRGVYEAEAKVLLATAKFVGGGFLSLSTDENNTLTSHVITVASRIRLLKTIGDPLIVTQPSGSWDYFAPVRGDGHTRAISSYLARLRGEDETQSPLLASIEEVMTAAKLYRAIWLSAEADGQTIEIDSG